MVHSSQGLVIPTEHGDEPVLRLPEWNALTNEQRNGICRLAEDLAEEDSLYTASQSALEIYNFIRDNVTLSLPPLIAPFHAADANSASPSHGGDEGREATVVHPKTPDMEKPCG